MKYRLKLSLFVAVAAGFAACGSEDLSLLQAGDPSDPRYDDLRRRLDIRVEPQPDSCTTSDGSYCTPAEFNSLVFDACPGVPQRRAGAGCADSVILAERHICAAEMLMRVAQATAHEEFASNGKWFQVPAQDAESNSQLAQLALRHALSAMQASGEALADSAVCSASALLESAAGDTGTAPEALARVTVGEELAGFFRESYALMVEARLVAVRESVAVSDAQRGDAADPASAEFLELGPFASRAAAGHMLLGGAHGIPALRGVAENGFFPHSRLSPEGRLALQHLRTAAMDPLLISSDEVSTDKLVFNKDDLANSLHVRLGFYLPDTSMFGAATVGQVYESLGVSRDAFTEARAYLRSERLAFDRSPTHLLPPEILPDGQTTASLVTIPNSDPEIKVSLALYATTRTEPTQPLAAWWSAVLRYDPTPRDASQLWSEGPGPDWLWTARTDGSVLQGLVWGDETPASAKAHVHGERTAISVMQESSERAAEITAVLTTIVEGYTGSDEERDALVRARDMVAHTAADVGAASVDDLAAHAPIGRARACWINTNPSTNVEIRLDLQVPGLTSGSQLFVVDSKEALECAVRGAIEGVRCTSAQLEFRTDATWSADPDVAPGVLSASFATTLEAQAQLERPNAEVTSMFVLRRAAGYSTNQPGGFEAVAGFLLPLGHSLGTTDYVYCTQYPIVPALEDAARDIIAPSTRFPADPAISCAGVPTDMLLPLENELTDDYNGVESSWQHYLQLAQQAADEADLLGESLIEDGLSMDLRAEAAVDELQRICGVNLSVSPFQRIPATDDVVGTDDCNPGYVFRAASGGGGSCVVDPIAYVLANRDTLGAVESARLAACLGTLEENADWVALGTESLCMWRTGASDDTICEHRSGDDFPCPFLAGREDADTLDCSVEARPGDYPPAAVNSAGFQTIAVADRLSLFSPPESGGSSDGPSRQDFPCEELAAIRNHTANMEQFTRAMTSAFMRYRTFRDHAAQLGWEASAGDHSRVTYASTTAFSTGRAELDPTSWNYWPMTPSEESLCPEGASSPVDSGGSVYGNYSGPLFCIQDRRAAASNPDEWSARRERARMNDRLARAVIAARVLGGTRLSGLRMPFYPRSAAAHRIEMANPGFESLAAGVAASSATDVTYLIDHMTVGDGDPVWEDPYPGRAMRITRADTEAAVMTGCSPTSRYGLAGAEWTSWSYESPTPFVVFNDAPDCDDSVPSLLSRGYREHYDWQISFENTGRASAGLPLLVRALPTSLDRDTAADAAARLWGEDGSSDPYQSFVWDTIVQLVGGVGPLTIPVPTVDGTPLTEFSGYFDESGWRDRNARNYHYAVAEEADDQDWRGLAHGNAAQIGLWIDAENELHGGLSQNDFMNGIELLCVAARDGDPDPTSLGCDGEFEMNSMMDLQRGSGYLHCMANRFGDRMARSVMRGLPTEVVDAVNEVGATSSGDLAGEYGAEVDEIAAALIELQGAEDAIADDIRVFGNELERMRNTIRSSDLQEQVEDWQLAGSVANQITSCIVAAATAADGLMSMKVAAYASAGATCGNSVFQSVVANNIRQIRGQQGALAIETAFINADDAFVTAAGNVRDRMITVRGALARIQAALTRLRSLQAQGRTALARALFLDDSATGGHFAANTLMRRRYNTTRERYELAHGRAVQLAYIARLALEQRLGVSLDELNDELVGVDPPASWADDICTLSSIDYERVRDGGNDELQTPDDYSGSYVGDYVRNLRHTFNAYNFEYPFQDGTDTVVMSLRDDVFGVRESCEFDVPNLLYHSAALDMGPSENAPGWAPLDCGEVGGTDSYCISVAAIEPEVEGSGYQEPEGLNVMDTGRATGYRVRFGPSHDGPLTRLAQTVELAAGRYRVSWWARSTPGATVALDPLKVVNVLDADSLVPIEELGPRNSGGGDASDWARYDYFFDLRSTRVVDVAIMSDQADPTGSAVDVAGVQLERAGAVFEGSVSRTAPGTMVSVAEAYGPGTFYATTESRAGAAAMCVDHDGSEFRDRAWTRGCVRVCRDGYDGGCPDELAAERCYYQTSVSVSSDRLQRILTGTSAGFASGNFNYRFETIGVNLVGSGLRDCSASGTSGCYGAGNASVSLLHQGPFFVRNTFGGVYDAPLFPGRIESARALMAERQITNPISSADAALLNGYVRQEFAGRPLGGSLIVRLWDDEGFQFERLEDVQLVIGYRYWQHQR